MGLSVLKTSSFYESPSYPNKSHPKFINIIVCVKSMLKPKSLMRVLITIEEALGRKRKEKNEPRTCDIDIIDYKRRVLSTRSGNLGLVIPHKNLSTRNFVLYPLREISPKWRHPKTNENISTLIKNLNHEDRKSILKVRKN